MVVSGKKFNRQDRRPIRSTVNAELLRRALQWAISDRIFAGLRRHGNTSWTAASLVSLAVLWVWSDGATLTGAFAQAEQLAVTMFGSAAVTTYQGLTKALMNWTGRLMPLLWEQLHARMEQCGGRHWRMGRWLPLALDGSRINLPRTRNLEEAYAAPNYGGGVTARSRRGWKNKRRRTHRRGQPQRPQMWLTMLWHIGLKMPWAWRTGPSTASERAHFAGLLQEHHFPENTLFCGDAGFVGFALWQAILQARQHFVIRVGANVRLLRGLGRVRHGVDVVAVWPQAAFRQGQPPLVVRLLKFRGPRSPIFVVTSVLSARALSAAQISQLYRLRWGIELQFRAFKQTFRRGTLRSRSAGCAAVELEWSLLGLWLIQLFAVKEQIALDVPPSQSSVALAIAVVRELMRDRHALTTQRRWRDRFIRAVHDSYHRRTGKRARHRKPFNDPPTASGPKINHANRQQRQAYQHLQNAA
jgi:hypothetical protein